MIAHPAVDLRGGAAVQLVGGCARDERVRLSDPVAVARGWIEQGFRSLHVIDLDAAFGTGHNRDVIAGMLAAIDVPVQVGGGVRDGEAADLLIGAGAARIIVGTRAYEDAVWLEALAGRYPGRVIVAADVRDDVVVTRGWTYRTDVDAAAFLDRIAGLDLAGILVTDVSREGRMSGVDVERFARLHERTPHPLIAAGGIAEMDDLRRLEGAGVAAAVLGMALYTGALDGCAVAREFGE